MFSCQPSIRQKIILGYYVIVALIIGLAMFTFLELRYIERKIIFREAISEFFDVTLEIRRFEKNFFLYEQRSDYEENVRYVSRARDIIDANIGGFGTVVSPEQISSMQTDLKKYQGLMGRYARQDRKTPDRVLLAGRIRSVGKNIIAVSEDIFRTEHRSLQLILNTSQRILVSSIVVLSLAVLAIGQILSRMVIRPLKALEESMGVIAGGRFERVDIDSKDGEIASLTNAFNKMLKELEQHKRYLIRSEKLASLGTLLSGVAHELNNPLSNISSSNQILAEELPEALGVSTESHRAQRVSPDPTFVMELARQINEQTDRARTIVRSLLDFSRDREFKKESLSLRKIVEETIRFVKGQIPAKVVVDVSVAEDIVIFADKQRIQQAFLNLIKNAVDAIEGGEGSISIKAEKRRAIDDIEDEKIGIYNYLKYRGKCSLDQDTVDIEVRDTGGGVPLDILPNIFDPFFTTKDVGRGSGLGLFIVHEIVEEHDGCIAVNSAPGEGTTFLIRLPLRKNTADTNGEQ